MVPIQLPVVKVAAMFTTSSNTGLINAKYCTYIVMSHQPRGLVVRVSDY